MKDLSKQQQNFLTALAAAADVTFLRTADLPHFRSKKVVVTFEDTSLGEHDKARKKEQNMDIVGIQCDSEGCIVVNVFASPTSHCEGIVGIIIDRNAKQHLITYTRCNELPHHTYRVTSLITKP